MFVVCALLITVGSVLTTSGSLPGVISRVESCDVRGFFLTGSESVSDVVFNSDDGTGLETLIGEELRSELLSSSFTPTEIRM